MTSSVKTRRKPRSRKALTPWLCGFDSGVDVVLPDPYTPRKSQTGGADVHERRLSRSRSAATTTTRTARNRANRELTGEARPHRGVGGDGEGFSDDTEDRKRKQKQRRKWLLGAACTAGCRLSGSSSSAQLGQRWDWESQARSSGSGRGGGLSRRSIEASASVQQQRKHTAENNLVNPSFNMGLGAALLILLSRGATEVNKLVELRKDTEALLNKIQEAVARLETITSHGAAESRNNHAAEVKANCSTTTVSYGTMNKESTTDCCRASPSPSPVPSCHSLGNIHLPLHSDVCSNSGALDSQARMMEHLEAELESELQQLELTLQGIYEEDQQRPTGLQEFKNQADFLREYAVMPWSNGRVYEQADLLQDNHDEDNNHHLQYNGVCPYRLERRLRELLETRQLDSGELVEYALQSPERSPQDKELAISRWGYEALATSHVEPVAGH